MKKVLKILCIVLVVLGLSGLGLYLTMKNIELNKSYEAATSQVTQLQAKLDAVGTFTDVYTIKAAVKMGQIIKDEDLVLQTLPTSSVPENVVTDKAAIIGNYYRIGLNPGVTMTSDFIVREEYIGSVYERDIFLDAVPVGMQVGDYIDIRVVLPGGEEFVVFPHKRVNARFENTIKMRCDEADLWLYTSMMVDKALYKSVGMKIYATKYVDPGSHDKTVAYYPVRRETVDIMNINGNLTDAQRSRIWNENLRNSIDTKLAFYRDPLNTDSSKIAAGVSDEESRVSQAAGYYDAILETINGGSGSSAGSGLVDPNTPTTTPDAPIGNLGGNDTEVVPPTVDGQTDPAGNGSVIGSQDYLDNLGDNLFDDETPIN